MTEPTSQDMTVQQAFEIHTKGKSNELRDKFQRSLNSLKAAGYPPDSTFISELNTEKTITELQKFITTKKYKGVVTASGMFGSHLKTLINVGKPVDVSNVVTAFEAKNKGKETRFGIDLTRGSRDLILPAFDDFMLAIDDTARQIPNKEHRAFFLIKTLTGLRNPDILNLQVGRGKEATSLYGSFDPQDGKLFGLSNKGKRINYDVGEVVQGILADLAADAEAQGRTALFSDMEGVDFEDINDVNKKSKTAIDKFRSGINPVMNRVMKARGIDIYDKKKGKAVAFSVRDLRKNIFTMLADELGDATQANQILGHSANGNVGLEYYKTERAKSKSQRRAALSGLQRTQELFTSLFFEVINQSNPAVLFGQDGYGFDGAKFPNKTIVDVDVDIPPEQQQVENRVKTTAAKATGAAEESVGTLQKTIDKLQGLLSKVGDLKEQVEEVDTGPTSKQKSDAAKAEKGKSKWARFLGRNKDTLAIGAATTLGALGAIPGLGKIAKAGELGLEALGVYGSAQEGVSTSEQMSQLGVPPSLSTAAGVATGVADFVSPIPIDAGSQVAADTFSSRPIDRMAAEDAEVSQTLQDMGKMEPVDIPDPAPSAPPMAAQGFAQRRNDARAAAMRGEVTPIAQSFLYGGVVR
jgi:hypothetical protein